MTRLLNAIALAALLVVAAAAPIGPEIPDDLRIIYDAMLRKTGPREASYEEDIMALARQDDVEGTPVPTGFTSEPNDGMATFMPILPGISVTPAFEEFTPDPDTPTPLPFTPEPSATPVMTAEPSATPIIDPMPTVALEDLLGPSPTMEMLISPDPLESLEASPEASSDEDLTVSISPIVSPVAAEDDDDSVCFPAHATVQLENGFVKRMDELVLGDRVLVASNQFSEVFMFTHKMSGVKHTFVQIDTDADRSITLTSGHYLYVNGALAAAKTAQVGDAVQLDDNSMATVTAVTTVASTGLYNPQTVQGDVIVNGIRASTYTTAVEPRMAHAMLAPVRAAFTRLGFSLAYFEAGADSIANMVPSGDLVM